MKAACLGLLALCLLSACGSGSLTPRTLSSNTSSSSSSSMLAAQSASQSITTSGTIAGTFSGGFTLYTGPVAGYVHVFTSSSTSITGPAPCVGEKVNVTGTGSLGTFITATSVAEQTTATSAPSASPAPIATPSLLSTQGAVTAIRTGAFEISSGYPHGYLWIATNTATAFIGGTPTVGRYAQVSGTGSFATGVTAVATTMWSSAPTTTDPIGTIIAGTPYGFTLNVSSTYSAVPIIITNATVIGGGTIEAGAQAQVTGVGADAGSITATSIVITDPTPVPTAGATPTPTPGPIAQKHVLNADYLGGTDGTNSISWSAAAPYLTWAQTDIADANAISAAGIKTQLYTDPNRVQSNDPLYSAAPASAFATSCSGERVTDYFDGVTQYVTIPGSSALQTAYASVINGEIGSAHFDAIYQDDNGPLSQFTTAFSPSLPCGYTDAAWISGGIALNNAAPRPVIANGLGILDGENPSLSIGLMASSNTLGGNFEGCYSYVGDAENSGWLWTAEENTELQVNALDKMFSCQERNTADASQSTAARIYAYASFLLTYNPALDVLWEDFGTASGFHVFPEEQLVALNPTTATPASVASLVQPGGAYGRLYADCYVAGAFVGPCGIAVNSNGGASVPFPYPQFKHAMTVSGYGVADGGTLSTSGAAAPATMPALSATIAFP